MLNHVLETIKKSEGSLSLAELGRELGVEQSALEGMISFWVRKGKIRVEGEHPVAGTDHAACGTSSCGPDCNPQGCPFIVKLPRTFTIPLNLDEGEK